MRAICQRRGMSQYTRRRREEDQERLRVEERRRQQGVQPLEVQRGRVVGRLRGRPIRRPRSVA